MLCIHTYFAKYVYEHIVHLSEGPTPKLVSDFWQMIWDHRPPVIVMLTQPEEKGKVIQ